MTMPDERTRNLLQAGAFLKELRADEALPEPIRREANRLLRHFPTLGDVRMLAMLEKRFMGSNYLTPDFEDGWFEDYRFGPHTW